MSKGKIASQVGHACVISADNARKSHHDWFNEWWINQEKVVLKVKDHEELNKIKKCITKLDLPWCEISDAGKTQVEPNTVTCLAIGPAPEKIIDSITGKLKLL